MPGWNIADVTGSRRTEKSQNRRRSSRAIECSPGVEIDRRADGLTDSSSTPELGTPKHGGSNICATLYQKIVESLYACLKASFVPVEHELSIRRR